MANKYPELTFIAKSRRWRKRYQSRDDYFPQHPGETKAQSYQRWLREWQQKKGELDRHEYDQSSDRQAWQEMVDYGLLHREAAKTLGLRSLWQHEQEMLKFAESAIESQRRFEVPTLDEHGNEVYPREFHTQDW